MFEWGGTAVQLAGHDSSVLAPMNLIIQPWSWNSKKADTISLLIQRTRATSHWRRWRDQECCFVRPTIILLLPLAEEARCWGCSARSSSFKKKSSLFVSHDGRLQRAHITYVVYGQEAKPPMNLPIISIKLSSLCLRRDCLGSGIIKRSS